jgi:pSer/pThr/pTyr-binding forkhead associated (FHA) protein
MKTITFGTDEAKCTIPLKDRFVSRTHARVTALANGKFQVEDLGSTNGTFVNGVQITSPVVISGKEQLRLGAREIDLKDYFVVALAKADKKKVSRKDYHPEKHTDNFNNLVAVYDEYVAEKNKINERYQMKCNALRSAIILPAIVIPYLLNKKELLNEIPGGFLTISTIGGFVAVWIIPKWVKQPEEDLAIAHAAYHTKFACAQCNAKLSAYHWRSLQLEGACPACKTTFRN